MSYSLFRVYNIFEGFKNHLGSRHLVSYPEYIDVIKKIFDSKNNQQAHFVIPLIEKELETMKQENIEDDDETEERYDAYKKYLNGLVYLDKHNPGGSNSYIAFLIHTNNNNPFPQEAHSHTKTAYKYAVKNEQRNEMTKECAELTTELEEFIKEQKTDLENAIKDENKKQIARLGFTIPQLEKVHIILQNYTKLSLEWAWTEAYVCLRTCGDSKTRSKMKGILKKIAIAIGVVSSANDVLELTQKALLLLKQ